MNQPASASRRTESPTEIHAPGDSLDGAQALVLKPRHWVLTLVLTALAAGLVSRGWQRVERLEFDADYRVPYALSRDYWTYERMLAAAEDSATHRSFGDERPGSQENAAPATDTAAAEPVYVLGDSVVWGEFVRADGTLSHFLSQLDRDSRVYFNIGLNGLFPVALEGLVEHHGEGLHDKSVLLHCNLLWVSNPEADLSTPKEQRINHQDLLPQLTRSIPAYHADFESRMGIVVRRSLGLGNWTRHVQIVMFGDRSLTAWSCDAKGQPWEIPRTTPGEPQSDPDRGPQSDRHRPWFDRGLAVQSFPWVPVDASVQWAAFERLVQQLGERGNRLCVVIGPLNRHMLQPANQDELDQWVAYAARRLDEMGVVVVEPHALPSDHYADASHPLTQGYRLMAEQLLEQPRLQSWLKDSGVSRMSGR